MSTPLDAPAAADEMARRLRELHWEGGFDAWPETLRTAACIMIAAREPAWIAWGREARLLYNDAARALLGERHPGTLGRPLARAGSALGDGLEALLARARTRSDPVEVPGYALGGKRGLLTGCPLAGGAGVYFTWSPRGASEAAEIEQLRRRLDEERAALASLFAQTPVPTAVVRGTELVFEMANPAYCEIIGGREVVGRPFLAVLPELRGQGFDDLLRGVMASGEPHVGREVAVRFERAGRLQDAFFDFIYAPMRGAAGAIEGVIMIGVEVTAQVIARQRTEALVDEARRELAERERVEQRLRESEARLARAIVAGELGAWDLDLTTGAAWRSLQHDRIFGYPELLPEWTYEMFLQHVLPEDRAEVNRRFEEALAAGHEWSFECRIRRVDGTVRWIWAQGDAELGASGQPARMQGLVRDITDLKLAEEALRDADRRKDEFLATLSHELRNPLAPLRNALHLLRSDGVDAARAAQVHAMMQRQLDHLVRLVDDLLEISRITRGTLALRRETVEVAAVVRSAVETAEPLIRAARHRLETSLPREPLWIDGDAVRLAQILANLLNNAAHYTDEGGSIALRASREGDEVVIAVSDTGAGIAPEALSRLFEPFRRGHRAAAGRHAGLGIGLALSRGLAQLHGGSLAAASEGLGRGSVFTLRLPLAPPPAAAPKQPSREAPGLSGLRILVVDDNVDAGDSLAMVLEALGVEVAVARGGAEALAAHEARDWDVVLLDIGMPEMDGYEVARRLREKGTRATLVALTGWGQEEDRRRAREAGFDHHLVKPVEIEALGALLAR